jgi:hypothetical protein
MKNANIIDLLDGWSGGIRTRGSLRGLPSSELDGLAERVRQFYAEWSPRPAPPDVLRLSVAGRYLHAGDRRRLTIATLYGHQATFADPIERWAEAHLDGRIQPGGDESVWLDEAVNAARAFEDLIKQGVAIPAPGVRIARARAAAVEQAFVAVMPSDAQPAQIAKAVTMGQEFSRMYGTERSTSIFLNVWGQLEDLGFADATASTFPALNWHDWGFLTSVLDQAVAELRERKGLDLAVFAGLMSADVPMLATDPSTAARIRRDETAFAAWRAELRTALRAVDDRRGHPNFEKQAAEILEDLLAPKADEVRKTVSRSRVLRSLAGEQVAQFGLGAAGGAGLAATFGTPAAVAVATAGLGAVSGWAIKTLFRPTPAGMAGVVAKLVQGTPDRAEASSEGGVALVYAFPRNDDETSSGGVARAASEAPSTDPER